MRLQEEADGNGIGNLSQKIVDLPLPPKKAEKPEEFIQDFSAPFD